MAGIWRNKKRAYEHPLEITGSHFKMECCGFLGGKLIEQERYFMKSDYINELADYFDKSDVASF